MPVDDLTTAQKVYRTFNHNNIPALLNLITSDVEWRNPDELPDGGWHLGPAEVFEALRKLAYAFDHYSLEIDDLLAAGDDRIRLGVSQ